MRRRRTMTKSVKEMTKVAKKIHLAVNVIVIVSFICCYTNVYFLLAEMDDKPFEDDDIVNATQDSIEKSQNNVDLKKISPNQKNGVDIDGGGGV